MAQGALGQTSMPLDYFRRPQFFDFSFASPYYAYIYDMRSVPFYNTSGRSSAWVTSSRARSVTARRISTSCSRRTFRRPRVSTSITRRVVRGVVRLVADQEPQPLRRFQPHGQTLFGPRGLLQQPHRAAGKRRCGRYLGHRRYYVPASFGRAHEVGRRRGEEHLPQQRLFPHAVLRHPVAADDRKRFFDGGALGGLHRPFVPVQFVEQGLHRPAGRLRQRPRPPRRGG